MPRKSAKTKDRDKKNVKVDETNRSLVSPMESEDDRCLHYEAGDRSPRSGPELDESEIKDFGNRLDSNFKDLGKRMDAKFDKINTKIDRLLYAIIGGFGTFLLKGGFDSYLTSKRQ
ncbi:hypothetical protein FPQ18DRAFT_380350 [Pyronema domesticum]|uniref:Uncharacterized protein n=1 Tax=Pyronema omphalodes (strain CBS 100304) TaxID=1076935 RepID=U4KUA4_PYROM|nr:hypothetical protein FPQ18DRAFT_380350 [Pyronema domesticum]CCX04547.1 Protein of unknown function [Pyronema omphalodes CBS 100304]